VSLFTSWQLINAISNKL